MAVFPAISRKHSKVLDSCRFFAISCTSYPLPTGFAIRRHEICADQAYGAATGNRDGPYAAELKRWSRPVSRVLYALRRDSHSSRPGVTTWLQQPTREQRGPRYRSPIWSCSEWGLPSHATLAPRAVRSYRTVSPLPVPLRAIGGLLSVALAVSSRCPGVTWHSALWSPDFPRCACARRDCPADSERNYSLLDRRLTFGTAAIQHFSWRTADRCS